MRYLMEFANGEGVSELIDRAMGFDIVHGVSVQLNETWLALWQLSRSLTPTEWKVLDNDLADTYEWLRHVLPMPVSRSIILDIDFLRLLHSLKRSRQSTVPIDPKWRCKSWEYISRRHLRRADAPFVINVLVTPRSSPGSIGELANSLGDGGQEIRIETRPIPRAYANRKRRVRPLQGGVSCGTDLGDYATLGGILKNGAGTLYGLTCGLAASEKDEAKQPSPKDSHTASRIGVCIESTAGSLSGPSKRCNRKAAVKEVDAALIELDSAPQLNSILEVLSVGRLTGSSTIDDVYEDSPVEISGRSGHRSLYTGGLLVLGSLLIGTDRYCFKNLMEIKRTSAQNWGVTGTISRPVTTGDSGAWVIQDGPCGPEWCGMVVGGVGPVGYAVFAENVLAWLDRKGHKGLTVV